MNKHKARKGLSDLIGETFDEAPAGGSDDSINETTVDVTRKEVKARTTLYLDTAVLRQVKELALLEDKKAHDIYLEALNMLFRQRGLKSIGELGNGVS